LHHCPIETNKTLILPLGDKVGVDAILRTPISGPHSQRFARQKVEPLEKSSEARKKPRKRKDPKLPAVWEPNRSDCMWQEQQCFCTGRRTIDGRPGDRSCFIVCHLF